MSHVLPFEITDGVSLCRLLPSAQFVGARDIRVRSCTADSRQAKPGDLFIAIAGNQCDGHEFAEDAVARGAVAVLAERDLKLDVPTCLVGDSREAFGQICQALCGNPHQALKVIGVTGTNGKTSTTHLIASILRAAGHRAGLLGTLGYCDGLDTAQAGLTTPSAPTLADWLSRMVENACGYAVLEVSSHAIAERRIAGIEFAHVGLTNLRRDHLDFHGSLAAYHHAKTRLFHQLSARGVAVINADDPASVEHMPLIPGGVLTVGMQGSAEVSATVIERFKSEQTFLLSAGETTVPVRTAIIGDHHVSNALVATAICLAEGVDLATIARGIENVHSLPGRLERIECGQPFGVFVDFAHTPDALTAALTTLREVTPGRLLCVFGAGGNRDAKKRPLMGRAVEAHADLAIVTNDNPRLEDPQTIASEILSGLAHPDAARWMPDRREAIGYALSLAGPDDTVLIAGRGHEDYQTIGDQRIPLDDREVARCYLYNLEPTSQYGALMSVANS